MVSRRWESMGFGPKTPDVESGVTKVKDLIELLYPERSTPASLELFGQTARALLTARAALTFENVQKFWADPDWRNWVMARWPEKMSGPWDAIEGSVSLDALDPDFAWLVRDRIRASQSFDDSL
jgi:hypothetical protein